MRAFIATTLGVIAAGVLVVAYGLVGPHAGAPAFDGVSAPNGRAVLVNDRVPLGPADDALGAQLQLRCGPGQAAVVRQIAGSTQAACVIDGAPYAYARGSISQPVSEVREYAPARTSYVPRRTTARYVAPRRDWQKTAMVIGGSTAAGAGLGAIFGGKKGALIGAAIGGGASTLYEARRR